MVVMLPGGVAIDRHRIAVEIALGDEKPVRKCEERSVSVEARSAKVGEIFGRVGLVRLLMVYAVRARDLLNTNRMKDLAFGHYAWTLDGSGLAEEGEEGFEKNQVKDAGSGALIAPGLGLTAKHVGKGFEHLDPQFDSLHRRKSPLDDQYKYKKVISDYATMAYQMPTYKGELVSWFVDVGWCSGDTDIEALVVRPGSPAAEAAAPDLRYFTWQLLPPKPGELVWVYGWPEQKIKIREDADVDGRHDHEWKVELHAQPARVEEIFCVPHLTRWLNSHVFG